MLSFVGRPVRFGVLGASALLWASLYALAAGAAAFAGERETGTLRLLDMLPADRRVVWAGKFSFALVTTLILTLALVAMAAASTERWNPPHPLTLVDAVSFGLFVLVALGWGLFWSSILDTALAAAVSAIASSLLTLGLLVGQFESILSGRAFGRPIGFAQAVLIIVMVAASDLFFTGNQRVRGMTIRFRSPIVYSGSGRPRVERAPTPRPVAAVPSPCAHPRRDRLPSCDNRGNWPEGPSHAVPGSLRHVFSSGKRSRKV